MLVMAACGHPAAAPPASPPSAPENHVEARDRAGLVHAAQQALHELAPPDYEQPFAGKRRDRSRATKLLVEACNAGDHPSCWTAFAIAGDVDKAAIGKLVETNCLGGDALSCRALPPWSAWQPLTFPDAPGAMGRSQACDDDRDEAPCDGRALRTECAAGFPKSCVILMLKSPPVVDRDALLARAKLSAPAGCEVGIPGDCNLVLDFADVPSKTAIQERLCELEDSACARVAKNRTAQGQLVQARDLYERACEYGDGALMFCLDLGVAYLEGTYREPVPGRGQALVNWVCAGYAKVTRKTEKVEDRVSECKLANPKVSGLRE